MRQTPRRLLSWLSVLKCDLFKLKRKSSVRQGFFSDRAKVSFINELSKSMLCEQCFMIMAMRSQKALRLSAGLKIFLGEQTAICPILFVMNVATFLNRFLQTRSLSIPRPIRLNNQKLLRKNASEYHLTGLWRWRVWLDHKIQEGSARTGAEARETCERLLVEYQ